MNKFEDALKQIEESMSTSSVFISPISGGVAKQPINGEHGNAVDPTNSDWYAEGDARIPTSIFGKKKKKKKRRSPKKK